ncbi:Efflux pump radE [Psilocybe cubensis]|uniref:Efflux pump radE n=1 Tax=Psilocybe cubensis TaxID=181762 RepID=A0ACB8GSM0_PSICU|nr:Efflux pump radE [Psilocybe cubensis]KAH9478470.1 Efflux pump radE [Psilocybe cubensis]
MDSDESEKKEIFSTSVTVVPGSNPSTNVPTRASSLTHADLDCEAGKGPTEFSAATVDEKASEDEDWESDPINPRNWAPFKKWSAMAIVSLYTFIPPLASSMMSPGLPEVAERFNIQNPTIVALTLTIFLLSFAIGPLFLAPLSEMYGRTWILHIGNLFNIAFNLGCAFAPTTGALIGFRFLSGFSGSAPIAVGGGSVSDLFDARDRAKAMAMYNLGPLLGPAIGPVAGGFITQTIGVKWVFIVIAILSGVGSAIAIPFLRETYAPIIRYRRAMRDGDDEKAARAHPALIEAQGSLHKIIWVSVTRPLEMLFRSFICFVLSLYMAFNYGIYYLMFSTFPALFSDTYGFGAGVGGLAYLGLGFGFVLSTLAGARWGDSLYKYLAKKNDGKPKPEMRIPFMLLGSILAPIGLFWYGWSAEAGVHWIMPIIGTAIFSFGDLPITLYLVDSFKYAASALAAAAVFRSMLGFAFPLFGKQMYDALGKGGGNSMLAGVAIVLGIPFPIWIYYKGEEMRARNPLTK